MKQSIVALIRPKLNLSQKESQVAHLIEHILVEPNRLQALGILDDFYSENIIYHSGVVNDFYLAEYYVVRSEVAEKMGRILLEHKNDLFVDQKGFNKIKSALVEEILENKGEFIDTGEQLAKAIYKPNSPTIRNPWDDLESISEISYNETLKIFQKYNADISFINLSFNDYEIDKLPNIGSNKLRNNVNQIDLWHPWQATDSVDTYIMVPLSIHTDPLIVSLYRRSLTDSQFGLLFDELRTKQGLVYDILVDVDYNVGTLEIYFASNKKNTTKVVECIKKSLEEYDNFIKNNLGHIKGRLKLDIELDWGNIQDQCLNTIDRVVSGGFIETPSSLSNRVDSITANDLCEFNRLYSNLLQDKPLVIKRQYDKKLKTIVTKD